MRRTNLPFIEHRIDLHLDNETPVTVAYTTWPAGTLIDPTTQSKVADGMHQPTHATMEVKAFLHQYKEGDYVVRQFNEVEAGDLRVAVRGTVDFAGKEELVFTIHGEHWVAKPISTNLAKTFSGLTMGTQLFRVFLLRKQT